MYAKMAADGTRRFYYGRQMLALGSDLATAKRIWAEYEYSSPDYTVEHLVSRYLDLLLPTLAANSKPMYRHGAKVAIAQWGEMAAVDLRAPHIARYRDLPTTTKTRYNMARVVLLGAYRKAIEWGWVEHNPAEPLAPSRRRCARCTSRTASTTRSTPRHRNGCAWRWRWPTRRRCAQST